jgi:hypothetical protein
VRAFSIAILAVFDHGTLFAEPPSDSAERLCGANAADTRATGNTKH